MDSPEQDTISFNIPVFVAKKNPINWCLGTEKLLLYHWKPVFHLCIFYNDKE